MPKALFTNERFKKLSDDAKILYGLILDRMSLSSKNGWFDEQNRVYIIFTLENVQEYMNCKHEKAVKLLSELDMHKGAGLVDRVNASDAVITRAEFCASQAFHILQGRK